jgi:hypothetical protein
LWLGNYKENNPLNSTPSTSKFIINENSFSGMQNLRHLIINSSLSPTEAFSCELTSFDNSLISSSYKLYVPEENKSLWEEEVYMISNFY